MGSNNAITTDPPYAAILLVPETFLFLAFFFNASGSTLRRSAVVLQVLAVEEDEVVLPDNDVRGAVVTVNNDDWELATAVMAWWWGCVNANDVLDVRTTTRRKAAIDCMVRRIFNDAMRIGAPQRIWEFVRNHHALAIIESSSVENRNSKLTFNCFNHNITITSKFRFFYDRV
jgi:hypothetical protein